MPRTFSLRTLLAAVTFVCVLAAVIAAYPGIIWVLGYLLPAVLIAATVSCFSSKRGIVFMNGVLAGVVGVVVGLCLFETLAWDISRRSFWEVYFADWKRISACGAAATVFMGIFLLQFFPRSSSPSKA
jgi:hypothetical protein